MAYGCLGQLGWTSSEEDLSMVKYSHIAASLGDILDNMSRKQDHSVGGKVDQQIPEADPFFGIEACGRLIHNEQLRVIYQRLRNADPALHTSGEALDLALCSTVEAGHLEHLADPAFTAPGIIQAFEDRHIIDKLLGG